MTYTNDGGYKMTNTVKLQLSDEDLKRLNVVAEHQGNDVEKVVWLATRLYLTRFDHLANDNEEKTGGNDNDKIN